MTNQAKRFCWPVLVVGMVALTVLVGAGVAHRVLLTKIDRQHLPLEQPLATLSTQLGEWQGYDRPIDPQVLRADHFDDDYVNRVYVNQNTGQAVTVFVGYVGKPRAHIGHRPDVCYVGQGWNQSASTAFSVESQQGTIVPSILYEFDSPNPRQPKMFVLATFVINGRFVEDPKELDRLHAQSVVLLGERPAYLARVQISLPASDDRQRDVATLRAFAAEIADPVGEMMPYWEQ